MTLLIFNEYEDPWLTPKKRKRKEKQENRVIRQKKNRGKEEGKKEEEEKKEKKRKREGNKGREGEESMDEERGKEKCNECWSYSFTLTIVSLPGVLKDLDFNDLIRFEYV